MSMGQKVEKVADAVYEKGKEAEWNEFWDACQDNGERRIYTYAFCYSTWNDVTFRPKYDIVIDTGNNAFGSCSITDLAKILEEQGVSIIFTDSTAQKFNVFTASSITRIPVLTMPTNCIAYGYFNNCRKLHTIEGLVSNEITAYESNKGDTQTFGGCINLEKIIFYGTIAKNINMQWSTKLNLESVISLFKCLKTFDTTEGSPTVTLSTETWALTESDEFKAEFDGMTGEAVCRAKCWNKA